MTDPAAARSRPTPGQVDRVEQNLRTVETSPDWADLPEILAWYKCDVRTLLAEVAALAAARLAQQQERDAAVSERESAVKQFQSAERDAQRLQAENDKLRAEYRGELRTEMLTIGADLVAADWEKRADAAEAARTALRQDLQALPRYTPGFEVISNIQTSRVAMFPVPAGEYVRACDLADLADRLAREEK